MPLTELLVSPGKSQLVSNGKKPWIFFPLKGKTNTSGARCIKRRTPLTKSLLVSATFCSVKLASLILHLRYNLLLQIEECLFCSHANKPGPHLIKNLRRIAPLDLSILIGWLMSRDFNWPIRRPKYERSVTENSFMGSGPGPYLIKKFGIS